MTYIWQKDAWPHFSFDRTPVQGALYKYAMEASALTQSVANLPEEDRTDALIDVMVAEAVKTSQIEGEIYDRQDVRSSIRNQLGLTMVPETVRDPRAKGVSALMISARKTFLEKLTEQRLFHWHELIIVDPYVRERIPVGRWRTEPVQIVSGSVGHETVHFEGPPAAIIPQEMARFLDWFNATAPRGESGDIPGPVQAAVAHLYFECIHPFADGNGRIGRAISQIALSQELRNPVILSLSTAIEAERKRYYEALQAASRGDLEITEWVTYFVEIVLTAQLLAKSIIGFVLRKARFWDRFGDRMNERQRKVVARMFHEGPAGFDGGVSAKIYATITGCSKATATRDLADLVDMDALIQLPGGGRSTRYELGESK